MEDRNWSITSAPVDEIIATLLTDGLSVPTSGLKEVFSKIDCRLVVSADDKLAVVQQRAVCQDQRPALEALVVTAVRAETDVAFVSEARV